MHPAERAVFIPSVDLANRFAGGLILILILLLGLVPAPLFTVIGKTLPLLRIP